MYLNEEQFNAVQISLLEGTAKVFIDPETWPNKGVLFWLSVDAIIVDSFDTYTEACNWVIKTVNI